MRLRPAQTRRFLTDGPAELFERPLPDRLVGLVAKIPDPHTEEWESFIAGVDPEDLSLLLDWLARRPARYRPHVLALLRTFRRSNFGAIGPERFGQILTSYM